MGIQGNTIKTVSREEEENLFLGDQEQLFTNTADNSIDAIITDPSIYENKAILWWLFNTLSRFNLLVKFYFLTN
ncbi:hypothetical protein HPDP_00220 [Candidatus Hepatincola sp. Pdp]